MAMKGRKVSQFAKKIVSQGGNARSALQEGGRSLSKCCKSLVVFLQPDISQLTARRLVTLREGLKGAIPSNSLSS